MGTYNNAIVEVFNGAEWTINSQPLFPEKYESTVLTEAPFCYQSYALSSFIAGVRNDYMITPIAPCRGLPDGHESLFTTEGFSSIPIPMSRYPDIITDWDCEGKTWVLLSELLAVDYDATFEDRSSQQMVRDSVPAGEGVFVTYREHLGELYFKELDALKTLGPPEHVRIVFSFT